MKSFEKFIKEEVDLTGNKGVPGDFMSKSEEEARSLGVTPDDERQMQRIWPEFQRNAQQSEQLLRSGQDGRQLNREQLEERIKSLEELAELVVREEFGDILETGIKPIELDIKLVPMGGVTGEVSDIRDVPQQAEQPEEQEQEEKEQEEKEQEEQDPEAEEEIPGTNLVSAIDKKKLLNMITQAAGKATKDIIRASDTVETELSRIFGERQGKQILSYWVAMSDIADKMDWVIPINRKSQMMKGMPQGMAGACQVKWESHTGNYYNMSLLLEKEATKIVIKAVGIDFPMLIHEAVKGVYLFLQSGAIKKDKETAKIIKKATSSFTDEAQDFRYGPPALQMLVKFINKFQESSQYKRLDTRVYTILAYDKAGVKEELEKAKESVKVAKEKSIKTGDINDEYAADDAEFLVDFLEKRLKVVKTDDQFLEITNSIFSCFDLQNSQFVLNEKKFNDSFAKDEISKIIKYIVDDIEEAKKEAEEYRSAMEDWNREQKEREEEEKWKSQQKEEPSDEESDIDSLIRKTSQREEDYSSMSPREIHELIDEVLDDDSLSREERDRKIKTLSGFLPKESAQIFLRELERINESRSKGII
jgi:hypothetical protein